MTRPGPSWGPPTRLAGLSPLCRRVLLVALVGLIGWGLLLSPGRPSGQPGAGDADLYRAIVTRLRSGQPYHAAAAAEQRQRGYPVHPFTTMRQPLLAEIGASLSPRGAELLLILLGVSTVVATSVRLFGALDKPSREVALVLTATSVGLLAPPGMWVWHELWAGLLVALSLACRTERRWLAAVFFALAAALIREFALPLLPLMAGAALLSGRRREAVGWTCATLIAMAALASHAAMATQAAGAEGAVSPGWVTLGGWSFDLQLARHCALLLLLPPWLSAIAVPLALLGWAGWRSDYALRVTMILVTWLGAFLIVGRTDNDYWGFLLVPTLPIGLALAPAALRDLIVGLVTPAPNHPPHLA